MIRLIMQASAVHYLAPEFDKHRSNTAGFEDLSPPGLSGKLPLLQLGFIPGSGKR